MNCPYCQTEFSLKNNFIAKNCECDDEERFLSFEDWYYLLFKVWIFD